MPLDLPTYGNIVDRIRADVRSLLDELDPTIFGSLIRAITDSNAGRHFDNVNSINQLEKELFPTIEATRESIERWAAYEGITPFESKQASGNAVFSGTPSSTILVGQQMRSANGNLYTADEEVSITTKIISVSTLTRSGSTVTATTATSHGFATGLEPTISGAVESEYNGTYPITVLNTTSFTYEITGTPSTPATGTILATCDCVSVPAISEDFGNDYNLDSGAILTLVGTITGVSNIGFVDASGFTGGQDTESTASLLFRTLQSRSQPVANFNEAAIRKAAFSVQGVTRVKVKRITPIVGAVTILFVRDDDDDIIPSSAEVTEVKNAILLLLQATSEESDVVVTAPTPVSTNYTFSATSPNTATMRTAIINNIEAFYRDNVDFETTISEESYKNAIIGTIDPQTGETLISFTLTSPSTDITVGTDSIGIPGDITF
jgi:uncharacterized phage protein gp47/JayE